MPDVESNALRRAKTLREEINARTGMADTTVTEGVKRLLRSSGNEVAIQHEASMMLDIYPDPVISKEEFARMMDYGDVSIGHYRVTEETEYIQLEYLENPGNTKVDTGFIPDVLTDKMHIKYAICDYRTDSIWPGIAKVQTAANGTGANFGIHYYTSSAHSHLASSDYDTRIYDVWTGAGITAESLVDDGQVISGNHIESTTSDTLTKTLQLFYRNNNTDGATVAGCYGHVRIYECEIYRNDVLIHDYVPKVKYQVKIVENLDTGHIDEYVLSETYGYHDEVTDDFFTGTGSDALRKGPYIISNESNYILKPLEYLGFTSSQVIYMDFVIQGTQKYLIDLNILNDYATGISKWRSNGSKLNVSNSIISSKTSGMISVSGFSNANSGRGLFGVDYDIGEIYAYNLTSALASDSIGNPNPFWYMIGCFWENNVEYYTMTGNLYGFELYDNSSTKIKDMKPMELRTLHNNEITYGLYDSINKLLYVAGKGTLQKGPYIN